MLPAARATDTLTCLAPAPNFIVTGSGTVLINGLPAARINDLTMHPSQGPIVAGSPDVLIGGPTVGATLGNPVAAIEKFHEIAQDRKDADVQQTYGNCGIEASRQLIRRATTSKVTENQLLAWALANGKAADSLNPEERGGTLDEDRKAILAAQGVPSSLKFQTLQNLTQAIGERRGIVTTHDAGKLWGDDTEGGHAVTVTGGKYDEHGRLTHIIINDTGTGEAGREVPAEQFQASLVPGARANITSDPVW